MYNATSLITEILPLIGWRKSSDPSETLNPMGDLLTASLGLYYSDQHPLLTIKNLRSIADDFSGFTYSAWSAVTTYAKGDIVTSSSNYYVSLANSNLNNAVSEADYWRQTNPFNEWLRNKTIAGILETVNDWIAKKVQRGTASNLLKRKQVLDPPGTKAVGVGTTARYVGWCVVPDPRLDITITIDRIAIQMIGSEATAIKLYKNGSTTASETLNITGDGSSDVIWAVCGWELERGNFYYVVFDRDAISAEPINALDGMEIPLNNFNRFPGLLPYAEVSAFEHAGPGESGWTDIQDIRTNQNNYGLNMQLSAKCDYTNLIIDQSSLFANAVIKRVAMALLREVAFNPNSMINRNQKNVESSTLLYEIDGNPQGRATGIKKQYDDAINAITFDANGLSQECLPCIKNKLRIGSI